MSKPLKCYQIVLAPINIVAESHEAAAEKADEIVRAPDVGQMYTVRRTRKLGAELVTHDEQKVWIPRSPLKRGN